MEDAREVSARLLELLRRERSAMAEFLVALATFNQRRLWVQLGYSSLFHYLHRELGMSKGAAHYRKTAVELIEAVPEVADALREGRLCITSIIELSKVLTPANRAEVLPRFFDCSRQEAKAVAAEVCPAEAIPSRTVVTSLPVAAATTSTRPVQGVQSIEPASRHVERGSAEVATAGFLLAQQHPAPRTVAEPLTAEARRLHVTVSKRFLEKLAAARDALSHSHPGASEEAILEAGLDLLIERAAKRRGIVMKPRTNALPPAAGPDAEAGGSNPRAIPAAVRREVFLRDAGRCQWPTSEGDVCGSTRRLELDHIVPVGRGGKPTVANLRAVCAFHNDLAAREVYGDVWMDRFTHGASRMRGRSDDPGANAVRPPSP